MIFDPVLATMIMDNDGCATVAAAGRSCKPVCNHCYRRIDGKLYQSEDKVYDAYCWGLRAVLEAKKAPARSIKLTVVDQKRLDSME